MTIWCCYYHPILNILRRTQEVMTNNRTLKERDALNPELAIIRQTSSTNTERGRNYLQLLIRKSGTKNKRLENWLKTKFYKLEESQILEMRDTRPLMAALFYLGCVIACEGITKNTIRDVLRPLSQPSFENALKDLRYYYQL